MGYRAFISYSHKDGTFAKTVQRALHNLGVEVFLAETSLPPKADLDAIRKAIAKAHILVLLWSEDASKSEWVRHEVGAAWGTNRPILPVALSSNIPFPPMIADGHCILAHTEPMAALLDIQSAVAGHWNQLVQRDAAQRQAMAEEQQRRQAESNNKAMGALAVGALALLIFGGGKG